MANSNHELTVVMTITQQPRSPQAWSQSCFKLQTFWNLEGPDGGSTVSLSTRPAPLTTHTAIPTCD